MTSTFYKLVYLTWISLPTLLILSVVAAGTTRQTFSVSQRILYVLAGVSALFLVAFYSNTFIRRAIRTGRILSCSVWFDNFEEVLECAHEKYVVIAGGGWSAYIGQRFLAPQSARIVHSSHYHGQVRPNVWKAGSTVHDVLCFLKTKGLTLAGTPSLSAVTMGGWLYCNSHGSGGNLWTPTVSTLRLFDQHTGEYIENAKKSEYFNDSKTEEEQRRYIIVEATVLPVDDILVHRVAFELETVENADRFLGDDTFLRMIFVDNCQKLAFLWLPCRRCDDPYYFHALPWLAVISPGFISKRVPRHWFNKRQMLSDANDFAPSPPLIGGGFGFLYVNFEVFLYLPISAEKLLDVTNEIQRLFKESVLGRCEIRYGRGKLFLDFAVRYNYCYSIPFETIFTRLAHIFGESTGIYLHRGKAQVPTFPMRLLR